MSRSRVNSVRDKFLRPIFGSYPHGLKAGMRFLVLFFALALTLSFVAPEFSPFSATDAQAQVRKQKKRKNIFDILFGKRGSLSSRKKRNTAKRIKIRRKKPTSKSRKQRAAPPIVIVNKSETASKILVAGDFMAGGVAKGLVQAYSDDPNIQIVDISKGLSGFVRDDVKNWPVDIVAHIEEIKPVAVVFLSGMNDRQQMRLPSGRVNKLTEEWLVGYNARTKALATSVATQKLPFIWLGLPPVKSGKMSADYLIFNEIFKTQAESVSGIYVDIWDGFTNAEGQYVSAGPDINGQIKRLRSSDGINMNKTGKRKLAFYAKKALRKFIGDGAETLLVSLPGIEDARPVTPQYDPARTGKTIVYSLAGPALDGGSTLAGSPAPKDDDSATKSVSYELVNKGERPKSHLGRVDHYGIKANEAPPRVKLATPVAVQKDSQPSAAKLIPAPTQ